MRRLRFYFLLALPVLLAAAPLPAQQAPAAGDIPFVTYTLENGLRVILAPDAGSTAVAVNLWYDVGSRHERPGRSGFAHLFEHLMFQGSENVERGGHGRMVEQAGGSLNASITEDRTNYFQTMPPDRYNLALWLESDRMRALRITEEDVRREIEVVKEERRWSVDNRPYGTSFQQLIYYAAYDSTSCFPYAKSVIGSPADLDAAELRDVEEFFATFYAPNNATLTVVGLFEEAEARGLIEQYFGDIPAIGRPAPVRCEDPFRHLPVRRTVDDTNARLPAFMVSYGAVSADHPDSYPLTLLGSILGEGESSRLHQRLVRGEQAAQSASAFGMLRSAPGLLVMYAIANQGVDAARIEALIDEEVARVASEGVTAAELERARNRTRAGEVFGRQSTMGRAEALQWHNHFMGDPAAIREQEARYAAVTADDVRRVAAEYLRADNRAVIVTRPIAGQE
jgi:zinc protease